MILRRGRLLGRSVEGRAPRRKGLLRESGMTLRRECGERFLGEDGS